MRISDWSSDVCSSDLARAAAELGIRSVAVFSEDDAASLHVRKADEARPLRGVGAAAYLDAEQIIAVAEAAGCDASHPRSEERRVGKEGGGTGRSRGSQYH